jgi:hypothetical protein
MVRIKDTSNAQIKEFPTPLNVTEMLYASPRQFFFVTPTSVLLFDAETRETVAQVSINGARYCYWSKDGNRVAIMSKHGMFFLGKNKIF